MNDATLVDDDGRCTTTEGDHRFGAPRRRCACSDARQDEWGELDGGYGHVGQINRRDGPVGHTAVGRGEHAEVHRLARRERG